MFLLWIWKGFRSCSGMMGRNRGRELICWGWVILWMQEGLSRRCLISVGKLLPQSREQAMAVYAGTWTVSSSGTLDLRHGLWYMGNLSWLLIPWSRLCYMASIQKHQDGRDLFSSLLSKPALLGLLPYWNLKDTKQMKLIFCHFHTLHPYAICQPQHTHTFPFRI